jgi:hypothetical protein
MHVSANYNKVELWNMGCTVYLEAMIPSGRISDAGAGGIREEESEI